MVDPREKRQEVEKEEPIEEPPGLPDYVLVYKDASPDNPDAMTWEKLGESNIVMDFDVVMQPMPTSDGNLERIFINMDSRALRNHFSRQGSLSVEKQGTRGEEIHQLSLFPHDLSL